MSARHGRKLEVCVVSQHEVAATWYVSDCRCGWQSPLCATSDKARRLYDAHRKRKTAAQYAGPQTEAPSA